MGKTLVVFLCLMMFTSIFGETDKNDSKPKTKAKKASKKEESAEVIPDCSEGSHYEACGYNCQPSCARIWNEITIKCTTDCIKGCFCDPGYLYDEKQKKCVRPKDCIKIECKDHEYFSECGNNCGKFCKTQAGPEAGCEDMCEVGCFCMDGFAYDGTNKTCVYPDDCTVTCGPNEEAKDCGPSCPKTCQNYKDEVLHDACSRQCVKGCFCKNGLVLDLENNECVLPEECPAECGPNQEMLECGPKCIETCENWGDLHLLDKCSSKECVKGCFCEEDYVWDGKNEKCVLVEECPAVVCGKNEVFAKSGKDCRSCANYKNTKCYTQDVPGCYCIDDHVRNHLFECVQVSTCEDSKCQLSDPNTVFSNCNVCLPSCRRQTNFLCPPKCKWGCKCKDGYLKDEETGKCVSLADCQVILDKEAKLAEEAKKVGEANKLDEAKKVDEAKIDEEAKIDKEAKIPEEAKIDEEAKIPEEAKDPEDDRKTPTLTEDVIIEDFVDLDPDQILDEYKSFEEARRRRDDRDRMREEL